MLCGEALKGIILYLKIKFPFQKVDEQKKKIKKGPHCISLALAPLAPPYFHSLAPPAPLDPWPPLARAGPQVLKSGGASGPPGPSGAAALAYNKPTPI